MCTLNSRIEPHEQFVSELRQLDGKILIWRESVDQCVDAKVRCDADTCATHECGAADLSVPQH